VKLSAGGQTILRLLLRRTAALMRRSGRWLGFARFFQIAGGRFLDDLAAAAPCTEPVRPCALLIPVPPALLAVPLAFGRTHRKTMQRCLVGLYLSDGGLLLGGGVLSACAHTRPP